MNSLQRSLDKHLTTEPDDNAWWFDLANEYLHEVITLEEWERREAEFDGFLSNQMIAGLNPPKAALELVRQLLPERFTEYSKTYPLRVPQTGETWLWSTASMGVLTYTVLNYCEPMDRVILRMTSACFQASDRVNLHRYANRTPDLRTFYRTFTQVIKNQV